MILYNNQPSPQVPDHELFNRIKTSKANVSEAWDYLGKLKIYLVQAPPNDPNFNIVLDQKIVLELLLESLPKANHTKSTDSPAPEKRDQLEQTYSKQKTSQEQEAEILAAATSKDSELELTKLAAAQNRPFYVIEGLANVLLKAQGLDSQYDLSKANYQRCIQAIREIELKEDPGEKDWKLHDLARKYGRSKEIILETYYKSLLINHLQDPIIFKDFVEKNPQGRRWLLRGWIPDSSLVLFYGHGGLGKTLFTQHLIKHIAQGIDWNEYKVDRSGGILYIQTDTALTKAVEAFRQAGILEDVPIHLHGSWRIEYIHYLYKWVKKQRPALVVIDSLTSVNRYNTVSENETRYAQPILQLRDIAAEFACSFLLIHHANSAGEMRGTKAVRAAVDEVWKIDKASKDESDPKRLLIIEKSRSRATGRYEVQLDEEDFSWNLLEPEDDQGQPTQNGGARFCIVNYLNKNKGVRFCVEDLAQVIGCSVLTVRKEFSSLAREGLIEKEKNPNKDSHTTGVPKYLYFVPE